ncbi:NAD-dependent succinate-semialdehyde dehydrogenase [Aurantiacibacter rhizosphaerae]|uniref:Aldehyde dehydrogenase family protein n=1 Tax=Aurantiacibacter rhizosphaerae TaxID=2691582 RepID=A0A844XD52_9SPHN|nr:NAD-dependent succinate-semialdehyde dehydrogenase [Aurantiacibacter rhizosphaerae]MWV27538.1 aldehyde dehydrogenase family protein [Aurantiacibacter rhizosphaerae]
MNLELESLGDAEGALAVFDPATGSEIGRATTYSEDDVSSIITLADAAGQEWAQRTAKDRAAILSKWFALTKQHTEELARLVTAESGKPMAESRGEVAYGASFIEWFAEEGKRAYGETVPTFAAGKRVMTIKQPVGTCAAITPWNFPVAMITRKVAPALAAGCAIVVKPAEATPFSALALERLAHEAGVPRELFRVVPTTDPAELGTLFCTHPRIRKLSFTGSTAVGKTLMRQTSDNVLRLSLELGGNAPFIVFDDADLDAAVEGAMASKYRNAGQTCVCANRILVQDGVHDAFVEKLKTRVEALKIGAGCEEGTTLGPLINSAGRDKVARLVDQALSAGAKPVTGATTSDAGEGFYEATILTGVTSDMAIASEEIFGPVAPVIRFSTEDEAIRIANDTPYGLAAYFYARDVGRVFRVMEGLEYGMVAANDGILSTEVAPFGGIKQSGMGREGSSHGLDEYLELKYCLVGGI